MKGKMSLVAKETRNHWLLATDPQSLPPASESLHVRVKIIP